jgi:hypothetical protein
MSNASRLGRETPSGMPMANATAIERHATRSPLACALRLRQLPRSGNPPAALAPPLSLDNEFVGNP